MTVSPRLPSVQGGIAHASLHLLGAPPPFGGEEKPSSVQRALPLYCCTGNVLQGTPPPEKHTLQSAPTLTPTPTPTPMSTPTPTPRLKVEPEQQIASMGNFSKLGKNPKIQQNVNYNQLPLYCCTGNMLNGAPSPLHGLRRPPACKGDLPLHFYAGNALQCAHTPSLVEELSSVQGGIAPALLHRQGTPPPFGGGRNPPVCKGHYPSIAALVMCCKALLPLKNIHYNQHQNQPLHPHLRLCLHPHLDSS